MKLPALQEAIIILDEPQALPLRWWSLVCRLIRELVETYNATELLMTATQPRIVAQGDPNLNVFDVVPAEDRAVIEQDHFGGEGTPDRVEFIIDTSALDPADDDALHSHGEVANVAVTEFDNGQRLVMAICNTVGSARNLIQAVMYQLNEDKRAPEDGLEYVDTRQIIDRFAQEDDSTRGEGLITERENLPRVIANHERR